MWTKPDINSSEYISLRESCRRLRIKLWTATSENEAALLGGDYVIYCAFSNHQLFEADTLKEISDFLRIGADHG
jgi:hypothetical protein